MYVPVPVSVCVCVCGGGGGGRGKRRAEAKTYCDKLNIEYRVEEVRESKTNVKIAKRYEDNFR